MRATQISCDECGAVKKEANHWWVAFRGVRANPAVLSLAPLAEVDHARLEESTLRFDLCSEACVQRTVSKYMRGEFKA